MTGKSIFFFKLLNLFRFLLFFFSDVLSGNWDGGNSLPWG